MAHTTVNEYVTSTVVSGTKYALSATATAAESNTKISIPAATILAVNQQFSPQQGSGPANAAPAVGTAFNGIGWEMDATIVQYGDPGTLSNAQSPTLFLNLTASAAITPTLTAILYINGVEITRGSTSPALTTTPYAASIVMAAVSASIPASGKFQLAVYGSNLTNTGLSALTISINDGANTFLQNGMQYSIQASRAPSDTSTLSDAITRRTTQARNSTDSFSTSDTAVRVLTTPRKTTETLTLTDAISRVYSAPRTVSEALTTSDASQRSTSVNRSVTDSYATSEAVSRLITYGRFIYEYPQGASPDYTVQFPTKHIAGFVRNSDGTVFFGGASIQLIRDSDNKVVQTTTSSTVDGSYSFVRDLYDPNTYHVAAFYASAPEQGITQTGLVPV